MKKRLVGIAGVLVAATMLATPVMAGSLLDSLQEGLNNINDAIQEKADTVSEGVEGIIGEIETAVENFDGLVSDAVDEAADTVEEAMEEAMDEAEEAADEVVEEISEAVEAAAPVNDADAEDEVLGAWHVTGMQVNDEEIKSSYGDIIICRGKADLDGEVITYTLTGDDGAFTIQSETLGNLSGTYTIMDYEPVGADSSLDDKSKARLEADTADGIILALEMLDTSDPLIQKTYIQKFYARRPVYGNYLEKFIEIYLADETWALDSGVELSFEAKDEAGNAKVTTSTGMEGTWSISVSYYDEEGFVYELSISWDGSSTKYIIDPDSIRSFSFSMSQKTDATAVIEATMVQ